MANNRLLTAAGIAAALAFATGCSVHKQETPALTGPSGLGTTITIAANPDVLAEDGASQSLLTITVTGPEGQPVSNAALRVDAALGTLSARNVVTNGSGQATVVFTAPSAGPGVPGVDVQVLVTPSETDFSNSVSRSVMIHLVPVGTVGGGNQSTLKPDFTAPSPTQGDSALFTATVTDSSGANAVSRVASFNWNFGDGSTATGQNVTHTFASAGPFNVTLTIIDSAGGTASVTKSLTVGQGTLPTATFLFSPADPIINVPINFNASGSTAAPGHTITNYAWNFGDGTLDSGVLLTHTYGKAGTYTVTLKVTDDVGRKSTLFSLPVTVTSDLPQPDFTITPSNPTAPTGTSASVVFDGSASKGVGGNTIVSYSWRDSLGRTITGSPVITGLFLAPGTYQMTLVVTDSAGKTNEITKSFTVAGT